VAAWLFGGTVALYALTFIAWKLGLDPRSLSGWSERTYAAIEPARWWIALVRIGVMFAVWWFWPVLVKRWFPDTLAGFEKNRGIWMALRHKVFLMFLFLEGCIHVSYLGGLG
jgi:hypothetical protein